MIFEPAFETMPREQLAELQLERLRSLVAYVKTRVPLYRERLASLMPESSDGGEIQRVTDLRQP